SAVADARFKTPAATPPAGTGVRSIRRTAGYGPVCPVVWEGRSRETPPYPDCLGHHEDAMPNRRIPLGDDSGAAPSPVLPASNRASALARISDCSDCSAHCFFDCLPLFLRRRLFPRPRKALHCNGGSYCPLQIDCILLGGPCRQCARRLNEGP